MSGPLIHGIDVALDPGIESDDRTWFGLHVRELPALTGPVEARVFDVREPRDAAGWIGMCMQHTLTGEAALDTHLRQHAPPMRADGVERSGDRLRATRRVLRALD